MEREAVLVSTGATFFSKTQRGTSQLQAFMERDPCSSKPVQKVDSDEPFWGFLACPLAQSVCPREYALLARRESGSLD